MSTWNDVPFDYATWIIAFPQFRSISETLVNAFALPMARGFSGCCQCPGDSAFCSQLLQLMVAHICAILYGVNGQQPSGLVGRINTATEGSVSVGAEFPMNANNAWFLQTPFGAMWWQLTAACRTFRYIRGATFSQYGPPWIGGYWPVVPRNGGGW